VNVLHFPRGLHYHYSLIKARATLIFLPFKENADWEVSFDIDIPQSAEFCTCHDLYCLPTYANKEIYESSANS
jgi:hypothetical protein